MSAPLPLVVIGGGAIGARHIEVAMADPGVNLVCVVEPGDARRRELAAMGLPVAASVAEAPEAEAAVVATPTALHAETAEEAIDRGWAALVEKPLCADTRSCDVLVARAEDSGVPLFTGHHRRCHPFSALARKRLERIAPLVGVSGIWAVRKHDSYYTEAPWRAQPGAGPILTNLSHEVDLLRFLAGEITEVTALTSHAARGHAVEDTAALAFRFESGALGTFLISEAAASPWAFEAATGENPALAPRTGEDALRFSGDGGAMGFPSLALWYGDAAHETEWRRAMLHDPAPALPRVDPLAEQLRRFAGVVRGGTDDVLASGRDGRQTVAVIEAVTASAREGRPIALAMPTSS